MENKKSNRGGKRKGAGRRENTHKTKPLFMRVRIDLYEPIKILIKEFIKENPPK